MITLKKTSLFEEHKKLGAKLVEFATFEMPLQYEGIIAEHNAVRKNVGIFDVSHMGEFLISGKDALSYLNYLVPNDVKKIENTTKALYTQICNEHGGTVDDLIIYHVDDSFLVVVNASNIEKDWEHFNRHQRAFNAKLENISDSINLLAVQGPNSLSLVANTLKIDLDSLRTQKYFEIKKCQGISLSRTGYTGEDGFEIFADNPEKTIHIWNELIQRGAIPCGLGARDTLRLEAAYPLYGHELDDITSPLEAGLEWSVKLDKQEDFIGKQALVKEKKEGLKKKLVCLKINDKVIARSKHIVSSKDGLEIGTVCSGSQGITVGFPIATAYVLPVFSKIGEEVFIKIRERLVSASIVQRPFYRRPY